MNATAAAPANRDADARLGELGYAPTLRRSLGFGQLLVYGLLFFVPMAPVAVFGHVTNVSGGVPVLVYLVASVIMGLSAVSYREMALRYPVAGSVYAYVRLATGPQLGFLAGWMILLDCILRPALLTLLSAVALAHLFPALPLWLVAIVFTLASVVLNLAGIDVTMRVGLVLLAWQFLVIGFFLWHVGAAVAAGEATFSLHAVWRPGTSIPAVLSGVSLAALSYLGFDAVATLNEEARGGGKAVARATTTLLVLLTGLFCLQVLAAAIVSDTTHFPTGAATDRAFYGAVDAVCPPWFKPVFTLTHAVIAIFACLVVAHAATARLLFALARDGLAPRYLARTSSRGIPTPAVVTVGVLAIVVSVAFSTRVGLVTSLVTFGALSSYVLLHVAVLFRLARSEGPRRWWTHVVVPVLGIATLVIALSQTPSLARIVGLCWLALGIVAATASGLVHRLRDPLHEPGQSLVDDPAPRQRTTPRR